MNYFIIGGDKKEYGPSSQEQIRQWLKEGRANGETLLRVEGETLWKPLRSFPEFAVDLPQVGTVPPTGADPEPVAANVTVGIGHAFARAWHLAGAHFGTLFGACFMVWMALTALLFVPAIGPMVEMVFSGPLLGGLFLVVLKLIRTGDSSPAEVFVLGRENALMLMVVGVIGTILTEIAACCCLLPGLYLQIAWLFGIPLVADRGLNFWHGLEVSRRAITPHWFKFFGLFILAFLPVVVFHFYMMIRMMADMIPHIQRLVHVTTPTPNDVQAFMTGLKETAANYGWWVLVKQALLLVSLPLGIGSFAFVYEDLFGRKR